MIDENFGIRVTEVVSPAERLRTHGRVIRAAATRAALAVTGLAAARAGRTGGRADSELSNADDGRRADHHDRADQRHRRPRPRAARAVPRRARDRRALRRHEARATAARLPGTPRASSRCARRRSSGRAGTSTWCSIGDRVLLVGATDHGIALLQGYDREEAAAEGLLGDDEAVAAVLARGPRAGHGSGATLHRRAARAHAADASRAWRRRRGRRPSPRTAARGTAARTGTSPAPPTGECVAQQAHARAG